MPLVNLARNMICDALIGGTTYNKFTSSNAYIGVGDNNNSTTDNFDVTQTDLQAPTNKLRKIVDSAPSRTNNTMTFVATFGTSEANFAWYEWGVFNGAVNGAAVGMFSRKVENLGTKTTGTWQLSVDVSILL